MQKIRDEFLCTFLAIAVLLREQIFVHFRACYWYIISKKKHNHWHHLHPGAGNCHIIPLVHLPHFGKCWQRRCLSMHTISFSSLKKTISFFIIKIEWKLSFFFPSFHWNHLHHFIVFLLMSFFQADDAETKVKKFWGQKEKVWSLALFVCLLSLQHHFIPASYWDTGLSYEFSWD